MKLNKKGFMLAEVVIVASVITTILVSLYISISKISQAYDKRNKYYDIDAQQVAIEINDSLSDQLPTDVVRELDDDDINFKNRYNNQTKKKIKLAYFIKSDTDSIDQLKKSLDDEIALKEYIDYLEDNIDFEKYNYLILVELEFDSDFYFYTLKVGDTNES